MVAPPRLVLDNSVTVGWFHPNQRTDYAEAILDLLNKADLLVPMHWLLELSNSLWQLERRKRMTRERRLKALDEVAVLPVRVLQEAMDVHRISVLAQTHDLTTYDAAYLDCTLRHRARLATQDTALQKAAKKLDCWYEPKNH